MAILGATAWKYKFVPAESCNGRDYNSQGIKTVPTLRAEEDNVVVLAEGHKAIEKFVLYADHNEIFKIE